MSEVIICPSFMEDVIADPSVYFLGILLRTVVNNGITVRLDKEDLLLDSYAKSFNGKNGEYIRQWVSYLSLRKSNTTVISIGRQENYREACVRLSIAGFDTAKIFCKDKFHYKKFNKEVSIADLVSGEGALNTIKTIDAIASSVSLASAEDSVFQVVSKICNEFKDAVELNGHWRFIYKDDGKGVEHHERVPQRLFYLIGKVICKKANVDISPEVDTGAGLVDFKFSRGYQDKVCLEIKYGKHQHLNHGYTSQIERYKNAESTHNGIYLVIDSESCRPNKISDLKKLVSNCTIKNKSKLVVIDGRKRNSASIKR